VSRAVKRNTCCFFFSAFLLFFFFFEVFRSIKISLWICLSVNWHVSSQTAAAKLYDNFFSFHNISAYHATISAVLGILKLLVQPHCHIQSIQCANLLSRPYEQKCSSIAKPSPTPLPAPFFFVCARRYAIMREYMPTRGSLGLDMMFRSCTIQVNLDYESETDMIEKFRIGLALQPVATALFANSPFKEGKPTGYKSWRSHVWEDTDPDRCGDLPFVFDPDFGFDRYVEYVLDVPMYFVYRKDPATGQGRYHNVAGQSFRDFMEGRLPGLPGELPTMEDWETHLTTVFPEVRLKRFIEMRGADGGPWRLICALPALWVGLLYDEQAQAEAATLISDFTQEERSFLRREVPRTALATPFRDGTVQDLAIEVLRIARGGLERRGRAEEKYLHDLEEIARSGVTQADRLLELYEGEWGKSVEPYYAPEFSY
jgi:glutamate--cysteine ligase